MKRENEHILFKDYERMEDESQEPRIISKNDIWFG